MWLADLIDPVYISLGILLILVVVYITEIISSTVATLLALVAFVVTGVVPASSAFSGFSNNIVYMIAGVLFVGEAMMASGLATLIGRTCIQLAKGREKTFVLFSMIAIAALSMWLDNTTLLAVFLSIMVGAKAATAVNGGEPWRVLNMCMPICLAAMVGGALSLVACSANLTGSSVLEGITDGQMSIGMFDMTPVAFLNLVLLILWVMFIGYRKGEKIWGDRPDDGIDMTRIAELTEVDGKKIARMLVVLALLLADFITVVVPQGVTAIFCAMLCCVLKIVDFKTTIKEIDWDVTIRLAGTLGLATCLNESGFIAWVGHSFTSVFGTDISPWMLFVIAVLIAMITTQFMGGSAIIIIVGTPIGAIATGLGINPAPIMMGITLGASFGFCTFIAGVCIGLSTAAGYRFTDYVRYNLQPTLISFACIMLIPLLHPF